MKFDKINFVLNVLSSETILAGSQNYIKLFVTDSIAETPIQTVEYRLIEKEGRNTSTEIVTWTGLTSSGTFYDGSVTPTFTSNTNLELQVRVTDTNNNVYILTNNMKGVI